MVQRTQPDEERTAAKHVTKAAFFHKGEDALLQPDWASSNTLWELEALSATRGGQPIMALTQYKIKSLSENKYLQMVPTGELELTAQSDSTGTLWLLHPTKQQADLQFLKARTNRRCGYIAAAAPYRADPRRSDVTPRCVRSCPRTSTSRTSHGSDGCLTPAFTAPAT